MKNKFLNNFTNSFFTILSITALSCFLFIVSYIITVYCFTLPADFLDPMLQNIHIDSFSDIALNNTDTNEPINTWIPSVMCPACKDEGVEVWVIYGKCCPRCGTACD